MTKYLDKNGLITYEASIKERLEDKQDTLVSGTNIKTINNESLLGSGNINISSGGTATDVRINGTSITSNDVADIQTEGTYNSSTNKIATMADIPANVGSKVYYGTSSTSASTAAKTVTCSGFTLETGATIFVKFTNANSYNGTATLNVNSTGAKDIATVGDTKTSRYYWKSGEVVGFIYDGTNYVMIEQGNATTTYYGVTKLSSSTSSTSEVLAATPKAVKTAYDLANGKQDAITSTNKLDYSLINNTPTIPSKTSDLQNDSGFITGYTETDPIFSASAAAGITSSDITSWNNKSTFSGNYNDLTNKPTIPNSTSDLTNDSGFIDNTVSNLTNYTTTTALQTLLDGKVDYGEISTSTFRVWDLDEGFYKVTTTRTQMYYNGASGSGSERVGGGAIIIIGKYSTTYKTFYVLSSGTDTTTQERYFNNYVGYTTSTEGVCYENLCTGDVVDNLTSTLAASPLSAKQGKALKDLIDGLATVASTGDYDDLTNKPTIPTVPTTVSSFTNDAGYITSSALSGYATTSDLDDVQDQVDANTANIINLKPTTLYSNNSGTKAAITLSDSVSNYSYLEIFYGWDTGGFGILSTRYYVSSGYDVNLTTTVLNNNYIYIASSQWTPSGTSLSPTKSEYWRWGTSGSPSRNTSGNLAIFKVLGYK